MNNESKTEIREYLLGRIADASTLENIEERLFSDDEFCSQVEVAEEELVHDYVFGKLSPADRRSFDEKIAGNSELRFKADMAEALKEKARHEKAAEMKPGFLETIKAFLQTPAYVGAFAVLLIAVLVFSWSALRSPGNDQLAELKSVYQTERAVEPRISDFFYAPAAPTTRGAATPDDAVKNKLRLIETKLLEAVLNSPTAENYRALGVFRLTQKEFAEAIKNLSKAVELDDKNARFHNDLGSAYFASATGSASEKNVKELAQANEEFTRALELDPQFLEALFNRSLALQHLNSSYRARESWNQYLQKDPSSKWADEARAHLAELEKQQGAVKKKADILPDIRAAYRENDMQTLWSIHSQMKGTFSSLSPAEQLTAAYLKARQEHDDGQARELSEILNRIGELEKEKNADFFFAELAAFYEKVNDINIAKLLEAKNGLLEGRKILREQNVDGAIVQFEKSKKLFRQLDDSPEEYIAELWTAQVLPDAGKISESRVLLNSLIRSSEARSFKVLLPTVYYWIGVGDGKQQKYSLSIDSFKKAVQKAGEISDLYQLKHSGQELATIYNSLDESERALDYYDSVVDKLGTYPEVMQTYRNLLIFAEIFGELGLDSTAADFALESVDLNKNNASLSKTSLINSSFGELTEALARKGQFAQALSFAGESNEIALSVGQSADNATTIAYTFLALADLKRRMNNCGEALADYEKSLEFYSRVPETTYNLYKVHKGKMLCFREMGRQIEFDGELEKVLRLSEESRQNIRQDTSRQAFFNSEQDVFDAAIPNALQQNDSRKAFELAEASKARSLLDFVKSGKSIAETEQEFASVAKPMLLSEIQTRLPENLQVIQYAVLTEKLAIWTLTKDRLEYSEKAITEYELEKKVSDYRKAVRSKASAADLKPAARELYDLLLPPDIESGKTICLIPDKFLHQVPFASLVSGTGKFLIEDFPIFYSPSASVMVLASENAKQKERVKEEHLLGVGNPHFDHEENPGLANLPQAEAEVAAIEKDYPGSLNFTGDKATKEKFLSNFANAEVIHFAGHFVANDRLPGYSKLLFSGDPLRSFELAEYRLPKAKLVVLSACETGFERYNRSEGAISIARTFLAAGVPLVLASSWTVDSEATRDLMIAFHRNRKGKGANSTESLRSAQLQLLQNTATAAPYYWSAFNPVGGYTNY